MQESMFSLEEAPVRRSASQDCGRDWLTLVATWPSNISALLMLCAQHGWSGKTCPVCCRSMADGRLEPSSGGWSNSGMGSPTESWTLNTSEWNHTLVPSPSVGGVCSLSDVLEPTGSVPQRYYLSARACAGILRRAANRERELPELLRLALERVGTTPEPAEPQQVTSLQYMDHPPNPSAGQGEGEDFADWVARTWNK